MKANEIIYKLIPHLIWFILTNISIYIPKGYTQWCWSSMSKEIQLFRPLEFKSLILCLGTFHTTKTLLKCTGKSLEGSGTENAWQEAGVYGSTVIQNSVLNRRHYNSSLDGQKLLAESMQHLWYKEFFSMKELQIILKNYKFYAN